MHERAQAHLAGAMLAGDGWSARAVRPGAFPYASGKPGKGYRRATQ